MKMRKVKGYSLSEILVTLSIIGVLSILVLPIVTKSNTNANNDKTAEGIKGDVSKAFQLEASSNGLIQGSDSPNQILSKVMALTYKQDSGDTASYINGAGWTLTAPKHWTQVNGSPDQAVINITDPGNDSATSITIYRDNKVQSNTTLATVSEMAVSNGTGTTSSTSSTVTNTSIPPSSPTMDSNMLGNVEFTFVDKNNQAVNLTAYTLSISCPSSSFTTTLNTVNNLSNMQPSLACTVTPSNLGDGTNTYTASATAFTTAIGNTTVPITVTQNTGVDFDSMQKVDIYFRSEQSGFRLDSGSLYFNDSNYAKYVKTYYGSTSKYNQALGGGGVAYLTTTVNGQDVVVDTTRTGLSGGMDSGDAYARILAHTTYYLPDGTGPVTPTVAGQYAYQQVHGSLKGYNAAYNAVYIYQLNVSSLVKTPNDYSNVMKAVYTNPDDGKQYLVNTMVFEQSPIKIALNGVDAVATDNGSFMFDVDGFHASTSPVFQTTGGLNTNEAWLVLDRGNTGIIKNKVIDGDAVFGDHQGRYVSGYEDLANAFHDSLQTDASHNQYIELKPPSLWELVVQFFKRLFGYYTPYNAYTDLKLLTADNHIIDANTVISRIDVTYKKVREVSPNNQTAILQQSAVYYQNGKKALSGDLWFRPKFYITLKPIKHTGEKQ